jgi:hypothetical protein
VKETDAHLSRERRYPSGGSPRPNRGYADGAGFTVAGSFRERRAVKTPRDRAEEKRQEKLDLVRQQLESGSLVIRRMTEAERRRYPPRPAQPKQGRRQ